MRRVLVVGCGGSGKSTLARELGRRTGLPTVHLDTHFWNPGWVETPEGEWREKLERLVSEDAWILDGNFVNYLRYRLERADTVIFLDTSRLRCFIGVFRRLLRYWGRSRPDLPAGCPERPDWDFYKWIWGFPNHSRPRLVSALAEFEAGGGTVHVFRSHRESAVFLDRLAGVPT